MELDASSIRALLTPFLSARELDHGQMAKVEAFLALLQRWNEKTNLTAIREPREIITRHFGESFFLATHLCDAEKTGSAIDFGSGAGFPGIPIAIYKQELRVTLIESHNKKATFLKEVVRGLELKNVNVFEGRGGEFAGTADLVAMRAVEKFERSAGAAAKLVAPGGRMALLIVQGQAALTKAIPGFSWAAPVRVPHSESLILLSGDRLPNQAAEPG